MEKCEIEKLLLAAEGKLRKYAYGFTHDWDSAEDLVQETSLRILYNADKFDNDGKFLAWAYAIMHNAFMNNCIRDNRNKEIGIALYTDECAKDSRNVHNYDIEVETDEIHNAIDRLPENAPQVMNLFISGHKYVEISVMMKIPLGTVKTRISMSRAILKEQLKDYLN